jgi:hypothetical protein
MSRRLDLYPMIQHTAAGNAEQAGRLTPTVRKRFWFEGALAVASAALMLLTISSHDWVETIFGYDPDNRGGTFEWILTCGLALACIFLTVAALRERRRGATVQVHVRTGPAGS